MGNGKDKLARLKTTLIFKGMIKAESFDTANEILIEAQSMSKRKNTILFALFDPRFYYLGVDILVRLNAGKDQESRVIRVSQSKVKISVNKFDIPQISVVGNLIEDDNRITDKVSLGYGTEMIDFIAVKR